MRHLTLAILSLAPLEALAGPSATPLTEPGTVGLLSIGVVAAVIAAIRRRK